MPETRPTTTRDENAQSGHAHEQHGLHFERYFSTEGVHPFDQVEWELRAATISNEKGEKIFEQKDVEIPK